MSTGRQRVCVHESKSTSLSQRV